MSFAAKTKWRRIVVSLPDHVFERHGSIPLVGRPWALMFRLLPHQEII